MSGAARAASRPRRFELPKGRRRVAVIVLIVLALLVAAVAWVGIRAVIARADLSRVQTSASELRKVAVSDPARATDLVESIQSDTADARSMTSDPIWRVAELTPVLGANFTAVRELAAAVDEVSQGALDPLAQVVSTIDLDSLKPVDGRIDIAPIAAAAPQVALADDAVQKALTSVRGIQTAGTVSFVSRAQDRLATLLSDAASITSIARGVTELVPTMAGIDAPRNYLLLFQNNAEARSLGGNPASLLLMTVDHGAISVTAQASSGDFVAKGTPPIAIDQPVTQLYYPLFTRYIQDIGTRPYFPTMATLAQGYWQETFGLTVDGVISFDPVALGYLLDATGPITLGTGDVLTSDNAADLLLSEVYSRYPVPADQDVFFAAAARAVFDSLTLGDPDPAKLFTALSQSASQGRLMLWSSYPDEQSVIASTSISGILPGTNEDETTTGVYFMDMSSSKIDYWVDTAVTATSDRCTAEGPTTFSTSFSIASQLDQAAADALPSYVAPGFFSDFFRTDVYVLGPVGATYLDTTTDVPGLSNAVLATGTDGGRPVVHLSSDVLTAGGATSATVRFSGATGADYGPLAVRTTPMVNATDVTVDEPGCS